MPAARQRQRVAEVFYPTPRPHPEGGGSPGNLVTSCGTALENAPGFSGAGISCKASRQSGVRSDRGGHQYLKRHLSARQRHIQSQSFRLDIRITAAPCQSCPEQRQGSYAGVAALLVRRVTTAGFNRRHLGTTWPRMTPMGFGTLWTFR